MEREILVPLVQKAQNGDSEALNRLFNEFYNDVYYFALKTVKDEQTACDVTQEAFIEIINTIGNLKEPAAFVTWMKQITYHQCTRYFKKKKDILVSEDEEGNTVFDTLVEENGDFIPDEAMDKKDFKETILKMLDELSEEQRSAVILFYFDELSVKQIAEIQGVSEGTVKSRLNYARKSIKSSVEDYEKKTGIKLHSFAILPLIKWLLNGAFEGTIPTASVEVVAESVAAATGTAVSVSTTTAATATATAATATTAATTTTTVGIGAKIAALPIVTKVVAGAVAAAVVVTTGTTAVVLSTKKPEAKPTYTQSTAASSEITSSEITSSDTVSSSISKPEENGELTLNGIIPEGCKYTCADGTILRAGMPFPETCKAGDKVHYGDYCYGYECVYGRDDKGNAQWYNFSEIFDMGDSGLIESDVFGAWTPAVIDTEKTSYGKIAKEINGKPIKALYATFWMCKNLETAPEIPSSITAMTATFYGCEKLKTAPTIPSNVERIMLTFSDCTLLEGDVVINASLDKSLEYYYNGTFYNTKNRINLKGETPEADLILIAQNSNNRNITVNGKRVDYSVLDAEKADLLVREFTELESAIEAYAKTFSFLPPSQFASKEEITEKDAFLFTYAYLINNYTYPTETIEEQWETHTIPIVDMLMFSQKIFGKSYTFKGLAGNLIEDEDSTASFSLELSLDTANKTFVIKREKYAINIEGSFEHLEGDENGNVITLEYGLGNVTPEKFENGRPWAETKDGQFIELYSMYEITIEKVDGVYTLTSFVRKEIY